MYRVSKYYGYTLNDSYSGLIHMVGYYDTSNKKDNGIMFLSQLFEKPTVVGKTSFISYMNGSMFLDRETIENDFELRIIYPCDKNGNFESVIIGDDSYYLYDDRIGTSTGKIISFEETPINVDVYKKMFSYFNRTKEAIGGSASFNKGVSPIKKYVR